MFLIFVIRLSWSNVKKNVNLNLSQNFVRFSLIISYKDDKTYRAMSIMSLDKEGWSRFDTAHFSSKFSWQTILRIGWEVRIKSIHNIGYKTAFYTSLYLLLSDSIQNILITFWPENTPPVSFKGESGANLQYIEACRLLSFSRKYWLNNNKNDKLNLEKCKRSITVILHARKFDVLAR